jgi:hypothetical protein
VTEESEFQSKYVEALSKALEGLDRQINNSIMFGPQPTEIREFKGGTCPICSGYGSSHGPEQGFPGGWTCSTCGGSGKLGHVWLEHYLPYPEGHPSKDTEYERTGWK